MGRQAERFLEEFMSFITITEEEGVLTTDNSVPDDYWEVVLQGLDNPLQALQNLFREINKRFGEDGLSDADELLRNHLMTELGWGIFYTCKPHGEPLPFWYAGFLGEMDIDTLTLCLWHLELSTSRPDFFGEFLDGAIVTLNLVEEGEDYQAADTAEGLIEQQLTGVVGELQRFTSIFERVTDEVFLRAFSYEPKAIESTKKFAAMLRNRRDLAEQCLVPAELINRLNRLVSIAERSRMQPLTLYRER